MRPKGLPGGECISEPPGRRTIPIGPARARFPSLLLPKASTSVRRSSRRWWSGCRTRMREVGDRGERERASDEVVAANDPARHGLPPSAGPAGR